MVCLCARPANYALAHAALATAMPTLNETVRKIISTLFYKGFKRTEYFLPIQQPE
jgi:hypothetical protein